MALTRKRAYFKILTRMYKAFSELSLNSLIVANTERTRQENTSRKLQKGSHLGFKLNVLFR